MTDRLAELRPGGASVISDEGDVEGGLNTADNRELEKFRRECEAISKVIEWGKTHVANVSESQRRGGSVVEEEGMLEQVEVRLQAARKRLKRIAEENKDFKRDHPERTAVIRTRVVQHTQLARGFMEIVGELERVKEVRKSGLKEGLVGRVVGIVDNVGAEEASRAIEEGTLDLLVEERGGVEARYQLEDVRERNKEIGVVAEKMQELHQMFVDMSIIVDGQQDLLNQIEYNVQEAVPAVKRAAGQLEIAREHQKRKRKKIICLIITLIILILVIVGIILIVFRNQIFNGGNGGSKSSATTPSPTATAPPAGPATGRYVKWGIKALEYRER